MKQIALLATMALALSACGNPIAQPLPAEQGTLRLNFVKVAAQNLRGQDVMSDKTTNIRIRISNDRTGLNVVRDFDLRQLAERPDSVSTEVQVPTGLNYRVEAISYRLELRRGDDYATVFKTGVESAIEVKSMVQTDVNMVLSRPKITPEIPQSITSGVDFTIKTSGRPNLYWQDGSFCLESRPLSGDDVHTSTNCQRVYISDRGEESHLSAPVQIPNDNGKLYPYLVVRVRLDDVWFAGTQKFNETAYFYVPSVELGETPLTPIEYRVAGGPIKVIVTY